MTYRLTNRLINQPTDRPTNQPMGRQDGHIEVSFPINVHNIEMNVYQTIKTHIKAVKKDTNTQVIMTNKNSYTHIKTRQAYIIKTKRGKARIATYYEAAWK